MGLITSHHITPQYYIAFLQFPQIGHEGWAGGRTVNALFQHSSTSFLLMSDQDHQSDVHAHIISSPNTPPIQLPPQTETMAKEWPNLLTIIIIIIMPPLPPKKKQPSTAKLKLPRATQPHPPQTQPNNSAGSELQNRNLTSLILFEQACKTERNVQTHRQELRIHTSCSICSQVRFRPMCAVIVHFPRLVVQDKAATISVQSRGENIPIWSIQRRSPSCLRILSESILLWRGRPRPGRGRLGL